MMKLSQPMQLLSLAIREKFTSRGSVFHRSTCWNAQTQSIWNSPRDDWKLKRDNNIHLFKASKSTQGSRRLKAHKREASLERMNIETSSAKLERNFQIDYVGSSTIVWELKGMCRSYPLGLGTRRIARGVGLIKRENHACLWCQVIIPGIHCRHHSRAVNAIGQSM